MAKAITRLFDTHQQAESAVRDLEQAGIGHERISLIANNVDGRHRKIDDEDDTAEGAAKGATTGGLIGGGAGLLAGLGMLAIPGVGPVVAAGWLVSTLAGAVAGAAAGGVTGGVLGALKDAGHSDEEANVYAEGVRRGGTLVSVKPDGDAEAATAERILAQQSGVDAAQRMDTYRQSGWDRFDETAQPYSADDLARERSRHQEQRSFQQSGDGVNDMAPDTTRTSPTDRPFDPTPRGV